MPGWRVHLFLHPLRPPRELHTAPPTPHADEPVGLPCRTKLMVCSAPPTQSPPQALQLLRTPLSDQLQKALGLRPVFSSRLGGVVFGCDPALGPEQGPSLRLGLMPKKRASLRLQTLGESLYLCSQTQKRFLRACSRLQLLSLPHIPRHSNRRRQDRCTDTQ